MVRCGVAPWRQLAAADHLLRIIGCGGGGGEQGDKININTNAAARLRPEHGLLSSPLPSDLSCFTPPRPRNLGTTAGSGLEGRDQGASGQERSGEVRAAGDRETGSRDL